MHAPTVETWTGPDGLFLARSAPLRVLFVGQDETTRGQQAVSSLLFHSRNYRLQWSDDDCRRAIYSQNLIIDLERAYYGVW